MLQCKVLIIEFFTIDALAASAIVSSEVTALTHEPRNDAMKRRPLEAETFLTGAQSTEIFCTDNATFQ